MKFGLSDRQFRLITAGIEKFPEVKEVFIFGSRSMGHEKPASDVDLLIVGPDVNASILARLRGHLSDEVSVPFTFDLLDDNETLTPELRKHLATYGKVFYRRDPTKD